ncbi:hypothetical protein QFZ42_002875 [Variovorax paradoxus]|uniref:hypothetical protein n=1 Tax=Variovorax paradoxus TaxID=34073 RepID=UPI002793CC56|nr:hypothetical protein [Variovorax paradoxus]MDQ0571041.1 hypothetical protein [Variovorax paradoxus]
MPTNNQHTQNSGSSNRGGSHEQHVRAGQQSHKNSGSESSGTRGGSSAQHAEAGRQSHKNSR